MIKQVILVRKDLGMRRGKEIAQGSHASMNFLIEPLRRSLSENGSEAVQGDATLTLRLTSVQCDWVAKGMAKICLRVNSAEELLARHAAAHKAGLVSHLILDSGKTEFGGVPTYTACAIGPDEAARIDAITGDLVLY